MPAPKTTKLMRRKKYTLSINTPTLTAGPKTPNIAAERSWLFLLQVSAPQRALSLNEQIDYLQLYIVFVFHLPYSDARKRSSRWTVKQKFNVSEKDSLDPAFSDLQSKSIVAIKRRKLLNSSETP